MIDSHYGVLQDNYLEEAMKMRNLLEEFHASHGLRPPTILGVREHVFTGRLGRQLLPLPFVYFILFFLRCLASFKY